MVYLVCQNNTHNPPHPHIHAQNQLCTCCALYLECSWECFVPKSLPSWLLSPESFRKSGTKQAQPKHLAAFMETATHFTSFQFTHSAYLKGGLCPWFGSSRRYYHLILAVLLWAHRGLFGPSRQPAQPSLVSAELPWFQRCMTATQVKFSEVSVAVSAGLLQWMQISLYRSLNRHTKALFGMLVQCCFDIKSHWFLGLLRHGSKG